MCVCGGVTFCGRHHRELDDVDDEDDRRGGGGVRLRDDEQFPFQVARAAAADQRGRRHFGQLLGQRRL